VEVAVIVVALVGMLGASVIGPTVAFHLAQRTRNIERAEDKADRAEVAHQAQLAADANSAQLNAIDVGQKEIHQLVNSNLTASMQDAHDTAVLLLAALEGNVKTPARELAIAAAKAKIAELRAQLEDRAKVQRVVDQEITAHPETRP
jgi:hypothetical protein